MQADDSESYRTLEQTHNSTVIVNHDGPIRLVDSRAEAPLLPLLPLATATTSLEPRPEQVAVGRRFVRDSLGAWGLAELTDTASLLTSEILTNAICHAGEAITLRLRRMPDEIITEVTDDYAELPRHTSAELDDEFGRGLTLVEALADSWGALPAGTGKIVWFALVIWKHPTPRREAAT